MGKVTLLAPFPSGSSPYCLLGDLAGKRKYLRDEKQVWLGLCPMNIWIIFFFLHNSAHFYDSGINFISVFPHIRGKERNCERNHCN